MFKTLTRAFNAVESAAKAGGKAAEAGAVTAPQSFDEWHAGHAGGFCATTRVATPMGWREASALSVGDMILSVDDGWQPLREIHKSVLWPGQNGCPRALQPLYVPAGVFGQARALTLLPEQGVMIESDISLDLFGAFSVIVPAALLDGHFSITRFDPMSMVEVVSLVFDREELVVTEPGAMVQCPRHGPAGKITLDELLDAAHLEAGDPKAALPVLGLAQADALCTRLSQSFGAMPGYHPDGSPQAAFA